jgi:hypothetical protein
MKSLLTKWRISAALDSGQPLPESLQREIAADPELQRFARKSEALGQTLQNVQPSVPPLHDSIMRAVRAAARREEPRTAPVWSWLATSGAVAAVVALCLYWGVVRPRVVAARALNEPGIVLDNCARMPATMPSFAMAPLSNEWARVDHNLQDTAQVLMASLP